MTSIQPAPDVRQVEQIAAHADPLIRNLQITQCYYELSTALTARLGLRANWCTFATWASKQAGQTIRQEDLARTLEHLREDVAVSVQKAHGVAASAQAMGAAGDADKILASVWDVLNPAAAFARAGDAVGRGNKKVFQEIGFEFARFLSTCAADAAFDAGRIARFCSELRPGDPPDGQRYLRQAFGRYYQAFFEPDANARAELVLLANLEIGFHEQTRLQPEIAAALNAALLDPQEFTPRLIEALFPARGWLAQAWLLFIRLLSRVTPVEREARALVARAQTRLRMILTEHMMTLELPPAVRLRLGRDLNAEFPPALRQITHPDLAALLQHIDPTPDSVGDSSAVDWADLSERIHFIADLFRCYQETPDLLQPPFTDDQVAALKANHLPAGKL